jgi:hypothetical protein
VAAHAGPWVDREQQHIQEEHRRALAADHTEGRAADDHAVLAQHDRDRPRASLDELSEVRLSAQPGQQHFAERLVLAQLARNAATTPGRPGSLGARRAVAAPRPQQLHGVPRIEAQIVHLWQEGVGVGQVLANGLRVDGDVCERRLVVLPLLTLLGDHG